MPQDNSQSILDQALGLVSSIPKAKTELRDDFMQAILPDALLPDELVNKQATDKAPMKTEEPKTLHGKKYDRRMKFNTAIERSQQKNTEEYPEWMKQAVDPDFSFNGQTNREHVVSYEDELLKTPPLPTEEPIWYDEPNKPVMEKEASDLVKTALTRWQKEMAQDPGLANIRGPVRDLAWNRDIFSRYPEELQDFYASRFKNFPLSDVRSQMRRAHADPRSWELRQAVLRNKADVYSRELAQDAAEAAMHATPAAVPAASDMFSKSKLLRNLGIGAGALGLAGLGGYGLYRSLKKESALEDESFTQAHPWVLPAALGVLGAGAGSVGGALLGGRSAIRGANKNYSRAVADAAKEHADAVSAFGRAGGKDRGLKDVASKAERRFSDLVGNPPNEAAERSFGRLGGGILGGMVGSGAGMSGGLLLNEPQPWEKTSGVLSSLLARRNS